MNRGWLVRITVTAEAAFRNAMSPPPPPRPPRYSHCLARAFAFVAPFVAKSPDFAEVLHRGRSMAEMAVGGLPLVLVRVFVARYQHIANVTPDIQPPFSWAFIIDHH